MPLTDSVAPLHYALQERVREWRRGGYPHERFPAISEILEWCRGTEAHPRFLRDPQIRALETYWYLRLCESTAQVIDLYRRLFPHDSDLLAALGLSDARLTRLALDSGGSAGLLQRVRTDDDVVRRFALQALRETLTLAYPSYILALAMGAGKTILVGAIIASEFGMALEYPGEQFVENALVFAPGKTILGSLRELISTPYDRILPPRLHKPFAASLKLTFTRDGEKDLPVVSGSSFNVVVTNTEKIRIQKETIRKSDIGKLLAPEREDQARAEIANQRLERIASLPHLAVFSDEAHHTYGQSLETELKKVRKTVDYLAAKTNLVVVVNTTGTPYYRRQMLRDVVIWYGLSEGIRDGILKDVAGNIQAFDFAGDQASYVTYLIDDFFKQYRDTRLPNGAAAKIALYFPQTDDLAGMRPVVDQALMAAGLSPAVCLVNTSDSAQTSSKDEEEFERLNDPASPYRVILLVNKGTEGWNCPSLFSCALVRKLKTSNNFVLQAATRCLRQVPGNSAPARIYLSSDNYSILDRQLRETYGEDLGALNARTTESVHARIVLRKVDIPPLTVVQNLRTVGRRESAPRPIVFEKPNVSAQAITRTIYTLPERPMTRRVLEQVGESEAIEAETDAIGLYAAATELAMQYRLEPLAVRRALAAVYREGAVPVVHLGPLAAQLETALDRYEVREERIERALALVKPDGFSRETTPEGVTVYTAEITYAPERERYLRRLAEVRPRRDVGFAIDPLPFDSDPEISFFEQILRLLDVDAVDVEDFYYTGALTDPAKSDFFVEYRGRDDRWHRYTPDFVIRKRPRPGAPAGSGRVYIVEVKAESERDDPVDGLNGAKAARLREWEQLNPDRLKYEIVFAPRDVVPPDRIRDVRRFAETREVYLPIALDFAQVAEFCRRWKIRDLSLFGSVLRPEFSPTSDVDFLYTLDPSAEYGLVDVNRMRDELAAIVGRRIDFVSRRAVEQSDNWIRRREVLDLTYPVYADHAAR